MSELPAAPAITIQQGSSRAPNAVRDQKAREAAQEFEGLFLSQMLAEMYANVEPNGLFGGGFAERTYQTLLQQEIGKSIAATNGIGIADAVYEEILKLQGSAK